MRRERQDGKNDCKCVRYCCINGILCRWYRNFGENDTSWSHKPAQQKKCRHLSKKQEQINDSCMRVNILGKPMAPERLIPWSRSMKYNAHSLVRSLHHAEKLALACMLLSYFLLARPELSPRSTRRSVFTAFSSIPATFASLPSLRTYICTRRDMATTTGVQQLRGILT